MEQENSDRAWQPRRWHQRILHHLGGVALARVERRPARPQTLGRLERRGLQGTRANGESGRRRRSDSTSRRSHGKTTPARRPAAQAHVRRPRQGGPGD
jgi:hypothetical protein